MTFSAVAASVAAAAVVVAINLVGVPSPNGATPSGVLSGQSGIPTATATRTPPPVEELATPTPLPSTPPLTGRAPAELVLATWAATDAGIEASAYVAALVEDDGRCTLHARQGETERMVDAAATPTGQNVSCGFVSLSGADLTAGEWQIWFTYASPTHEGTSSSVSVTFGGQQ